MDQQVAPRLSSDLPIFHWGDYHSKNPLSEPSRPLSQEFVTSDIASLLSARSYPLSESHNSYNAQSSTALPNPGEFAIERAFYFNQRNTNSERTTPQPQKRQRRGPRNAASAKKSGAPREGSDSKENSEERRRIQTRNAQRAYRSRQQATVEGLKNRISILETSMEKMSSAMLSFSEQLVQSGVLRSHSALTANLRDTMKVFHAMASRASLDDEIKDSVDSNKIIEPLPALQQPTNKLSSPNIPLHPPLDGTTLYQPSSAVLPCTVNSPEISVMEVSEFLERLVLVGLYQGTLALCNPSIGLDQLRRPFGLILTMMSRERLASYFRAELYAHVSQKPLDGWEEVPFFRLGGAGTHYSDGRAGSSRYQRWDTVEDPLSLVSADLRTQLEGDWFDLQDLEGYIRDNNVLLLSSSGEPRKCSSVQTNINVSRFISALISKGVCLGRTPGFQRDDVRKALHFSKIA